MYTFSIYLKFLFQTKNFRQIFCLFTVLKHLFIFFHTPWCPFLFLPMPVLIICYIHIHVRILAYSVLLRSTSRVVFRFCLNSIYVNVASFCPSLRWTNAFKYFYYLLLLLNSLLSSLPLSPE